MKIIATGDNHFDQHNRFAETVRVHAWIADLVERERPDAFLCGGDIYERASTPLERSAVADWLVRIAAVCPVVIARGNHDKPRDCEILARLASAHPIIVEEQAAVHVVAGIAIATVAWPHRAELLAAAGDSGSSGADEIASTALRNVLRGLGDQLARHDGPRVLLGHFMIDGSVTSSGQPLVGHSMNVALSDLGLARAEITLASHIHAPQEWEFSGRPIVYAGSPCRTNFGEIEEKSVVLAEFDGARLCAWRRVPTPATPMIHLDARVVFVEGTPDLDIDGDLESVAGAEVRLRYEVDADQREAGKRAAEEWRGALRARDAVDVQVEEVVRAVTRARAPEVARAATIAEKVREYWTAKGDVPPADRAVALLAKVHLLDEAVPRATGSGCPGRFESIRARNIGPFRSVDVELADTHGLVAVTGGNGAGKSTFLELLGGAYYRRTPTRGTLVDLATARDSFVEVRTCTDAAYVLRHTLDAVSKKSDAIALDSSGHTLTDAGKVREYDAWAARALPGEDVLYTSTFAAQGSGGFLEMKPTARKAVILRTLGIERVEALADLARAKLAAAKLELEKLDARIDDERARSQSIDAAREVLAHAEEQVVKARTQGEAAEKASRDAERAAEAADRARAERADIQRQVDAHDADVIGAVRRRLAAKATADRAGSIESARAALAALERDVVPARDELNERAAALATVERDAAEASRRLQERREHQDAIIRLTAELETAERDVAQARALAERVAEIEAGRVLLAELESHLGRRRRDLEAIRGSLTLAERADVEARAAARELLVERDTLQKRAARLETALADEEAVRDAAARLDAELAEINGMRADRGAIEERIRVSRASLLSSKDDRIDALREGLTRIAESGELPARSYREHASDVLSVDDTASVAAANAPEAIRADERALVELTGRIDAADRRANATAVLADRVAEMDAARAEQADTLRRVNEVLLAIADSDTKAAGRAAELADLRSRARQAEETIRTTEGDIAETRAGLADADAVARAQTLAEARERDVARIRTTRDERAAKLAELPALPAVSAGTVRADHEAATARVRRLEADLERTRALLADADAVARATAEVEAAERDIARGEGAIRELRGRLAAIEAIPAVDVDAALDAAQRAHEERTRCESAVAKARAIVQVAEESEARVAALATERDAQHVEVADWTRLSLDLGKDGLQALEVDAAGPELAAVANDLLHSCVSRRWTIDIRTQRASADGKRTIEDCDVVILDTERGREGEAETFSGGERVLIGEAVSLALSVFACRRLGVEGPTLVRDESGAALSPENGRRYIEMLRRAAATIGADRVLYVSHTPELQELADARIHVADGTARIVPVDYEPPVSRERSTHDSGELFASAAE